MVFSGKPAGIIRQWENLLSIIRQALQLQQQEKGCFMKLKNVFVLCLLVSSFAILLRADTSGQTNSTEPVPSEYRNMYEELDSKIKDFDDFLNSKWNGEKYASLMFSTELLSANGHRTKELLAPNALAGNILWLKRLKSLGINVITIQISYPLLSPDYPDSRKYLEFYQKLVKEIRKMGFKIHIKTNALFTDKSFIDNPPDYSSLTVEQYLEGRKEQAILIAKVLHPDYLTIANEPATEMAQTHKRITLKEYINYINDTLDKIDHNGILIGAGSGTWENPAYIKALARTGIDFIDLHIYPLSGGTHNYLERAVQMAEIARRNGKKVIVGECWLYKASVEELSGQNRLKTMMSPSTQYKRDSFNFFEPLDKEFLKVMVKFAHYEKIEFISPFWAKQFFAYIPYNESTSKMTYKEVVRLANLKASKNISDGVFSETGITYKKLITEGP